MQTSPKLRNGKSASELNRLPRSKKVEDDTPEIIRAACRAAVTEALRSLEISTRRLLTIEQTAQYLTLSEREVHNMIAAKALTAVRHGRRKMVDIRDLETWIASHKAA
jgi:excisionase family DNA binding protein